MVRNYADTVTPTRQCVAGVRIGIICHFRRLFFRTFFLREKKVQKEILKYWTIYKNLGQSNDYNNNKENLFIKRIKTKFKFVKIR
jgi:hypothetical protein